MTQHVEGPGSLPDPGPTDETVDSEIKDSPRPRIRVAKDLHLLTGQALWLLARVNDRCPCVFRHDSVQARFRSDLDRPILERLADRVLRQIMAEHATWWKLTWDGLIQVDPPSNMIANTLATPG